MSFQTFIDNRTPFSAEKFVLPDPGGQEVLLLVVVATFQASGRGGPMQLAENQTAVRLTEKHYGDPASSSILYESNLALEKPFVDVLLNASAYAPGDKPTRKVSVEVQVGSIHKRLLVHGDRRWQIGPFGRQPAQPEWFLKMPIVYERAFGGVDQSAKDVRKRHADPRNPIGVGFRGATSADPSIRTQLPNIEYPHDLVKSYRHQPEPAGLGAIARNWVPRLGYAGTYDEAWLNEQWPLLPTDFDPRYNQAAPIDQQCKALRGGEEVKLRNLTPNGEWCFSLPRLDIPVHLRYKDRLSHTELCPDTILIEPDLYKVTLTSRLKIESFRGQGVVKEIILGHMLPGWLRAKLTDKAYIDMRNTDGVDSSAPFYYL